MPHPQPFPGVQLFKRALGVDREICISSSVMSAGMERVLRYRSPVSGSMRSTVAPLAASRQTCSAPANVAPAVMPTKMPSLLGELAAAMHRVSVGNRQNTIDYVHSHRITRQLRNKIGAPPLHRMRLPGGVGRRGRPVRLPLLRARLVSTGASAGSQTTIFVSGRSLARTRATPFRVPPVPKPVTQ